MTYIKECRKAKADIVKAELKMQRKAEKDAKKLQKEGNTGT